MPGEKGLLYKGLAGERRCESRFFRPLNITTDFFVLLHFSLLPLYDCSYRAMPLVRSRDGSSIITDAGEFDRIDWGGKEEFCTNNNSDL